VKVGVMTYCEIAYQLRQHTGCLQHEVVSTVVNNKEINVFLTLIYDF